jgi:DNA-binding NarL/FixJ family response regulator
VSGPLRVLLADAAPLQRAGLRTVLTGRGPLRAGATGTPLPGTTGTPLPGTTGTPLPGTTGTPLPGTGGTPLPGTGDTPLPGTGDTLTPGNPGTPLPSSGDTLTPGATGTPPPGAGGMPLPGAGGTLLPGSGGMPLPGAGGLFPTGDHGPVGGMREIVVAGETGDGVEAVDLARRLLPDVLIIDVALPRQDGIAVTRAVTGARLPVRVLILTGRDTDEEAFAAIAAGAAGYLCKEAPQAELITAVHAVAAGGAVVTPPVLARMLTRLAGTPPADSGQSAAARLSPLTGREREVLVHVARGRSNSEIAATLGVSETTVKTHVGHVLTKLRLRDRTQAVVLAYETGLVRPGA